MDRRFAIAQRFAATPGENRLDLRDQRERQFFRRFRAEIKTCRREDISVDRDSFIENGLQQMIAPLPRPQQPDILQIEFQQCAKRGEIPPVIVRLHDGGGSTINVARKLSRLVELENFPTQNLGDYVPGKTCSIKTGRRSPPQIMKVELG